MKTLIFVFLAVILVSCNEHRTSYVVTHVKATKIQSDLLIGVPVVMKINQLDSILWISDCSTEMMVSGIEKHTGRVLCKLARKGNGPSEMAPPVQIFFSNADICLYDRNKFRLYRTSSNSVLTGNANKIPEICSLPNGHSLIHKLTDTTYIGTGFFEKRFSIIDLFGNELYQAGEFPLYWDGEKHFPKRIRTMYHQTTRLSNHPSLPLFVAGTSDVLSAYKIEANTITEIFEIPLHDYAYDYSDGTFISTSKLPHITIGIRDIVCGNENIYVLYDTRQESDNTHKKCNEIRVYDWNGKLTKKILPDINFSIFTLDVSQKTIYGISDDENEPAIWRVHI